MNVDCRSSSRRRSANNSKGRGDSNRFSKSTGGTDGYTNKDTGDNGDQCSRGAGGEQQGGMHSGNSHFRSAPGPDEGGGLGASWEGVNRDELVMLLLQTLSSLGYEKSRRMLEEEANIRLETELQAAIHSAILASDLSEASDLLGRLAMPQELKSKCDFQLQLFKYTEHLQRGDIEAAVGCLRNDLTKFCDAETGDDAFAKYCGWLLAGNPKDLQYLIEQDSHQPFTRQQLWTAIVSYLAPAYACPKDRLAVLIKQALELQEHKCEYHQRLGCVSTARSRRSLLIDHRCTKFDIKSQIVGRLVDQKDEILYVEASHNGKYLATGSKDGTVAFYSARPPKFSLITELHGHKDAVTEVGWNNDDTMLLSISNDNNIRIWAVDPPSEATLLRQVVDESWRSDTKYITTAGACWLPNNCQIIYHWGIRKIYLSNTVTEFRTSFEQYRWKLNTIVRDATVTHDGSMLVILEANDSIRVIDLHTKEKLFHFSETCPVVCISASTLKRRILTSCTGGNKPVIRLWNLDTQSAECTYVGHCQRRFVVRPVFAGVDDAFVVCGGEDAKICIWDRVSGVVLKILLGHNDAVNSVTWVGSPGSSTSYLFSASDDSRVLVWKLSPEEGEWNGGTAKKAGNKLKRHNRRGAAVESGEADTPLVAAGSGVHACGGAAKKRGQSNNHRTGGRHQRASRAPSSSSSGAVTAVEGVGGGSAGTDDTVGAAVDVGGGTAGDQLTTQDENMNWLRI